MAKEPREVSTKQTVTMHSTTTGAGLGRYFTDIEDAENQARRPKQVEMSFQLPKYPITYQHSRAIHAFNLNFPFSAASSARTAITQTLDSISNPKSYQINVMYAFGCVPSATRAPPTGEPQSA